MKIKIMRVTLPGSSDLRITLITVKEKYSITKNKMVLNDLKYACNMHVQL